MPDAKKIESLCWEARAKISWGDPPGEVAAWLKIEGMEPRRIEEIIQACVKERADDIRKRGIADVAIGMGLLLAGALLFLASTTGSIRSSRGMAAGLMGAMWLWERRTSRQRENQLDETHARILSDRVALDEVIAVVRQNAEAMTRLSTLQEQLLLRLRVNVTSQTSTQTLERKSS